MGVETQSLEADISGVLLQPLSVIETVGGPVLHLLRSEYALMPYREHFGEIYFSEVNPGQVKAWKRHSRQTQLFAVPVGLMKLVLFDEREDSPTKGTVQEFLLGRPDYYALLKIPCGIWYGFTPVGKEPVLVCNCADIPHDPLESERIPWNSTRIPYSF